MESPRPTSSAHARQTRQQFVNPEDYLSYELGKAVRELPPLYTRLLAGSLTALVLGAITWAHFSKVDEVATTQGELIPAQQVRPVRALDGGIIREIRVKEGDRVQQGDILIEQDPDVSDAAVERLRQSAELIRQDIARLEAERTGQTRAGTALQDQLLAARLREFDTRQAAAVAETNRQSAAIAEARAQLARLQENLSNARISLRNAEERERSLRGLVDGAIPRFDYLEAKDRLTQAQDQVSSLEQEIAGQRQAIRQAEQAYQAARQASGTLSSQREGEIIAQLNQRREELTNIEGQLEQATKQRDRETLRAPISGRIYNVQATLGEGTVEPGEELLSILPDGNNLMLEVKVLNRDIGFIHEGMRAKVKLATFPFQEFGTIEGKVVQISPNATLDENLGLIFTATIELSRTTVRVQNRDVELVPGMAATAELVTRQRSVLTFLIEPITRRFDEAFGVR
ncbi:HlyD family type I secretion periplasmic adaptor subunit [Oscillatoria sp. FACHB-1407]|uniref:HlyD family type I secretion periplasmic adaptor subunit n=1 Tax=Oscillatoria sp. FACHB-1407 TaxID=2692847 RepID=UPI001688D824|nr:HlyD family type I secretion periplasmic adaptor subunit [Oscillatoria sp. FACHB-1407]MBD2461822.1 HlyD family type I secretion periplasmic adaptor subunit [Oscillatoria sp. FACHB-1407]